MAINWNELKKQNENLAAAGFQFHPTQPGQMIPVQGNPNRYYITSAQWLSYYTAAPAKSYDDEFRETHLQTEED